MRALVIGRGSMGRRRIRDLTALGLEVESWDITDGESAPFAPTWDKGFVGQALVVVSTPPLTKNPYVQSEHNFFTECDVEAVKTEGIYRHFPSATPLFTEWWPEMQRVGDQQAYTHWCGSHLEDWHPAADPATYYALHDPSLALREMIAFELIPITKVYGRVVKAWPVVKQPMFWQIHLDHERGASGSLTIDIGTRPAVRHHNMIQMRYTESDYLAEMRGLVAAVKGEQPWPYSQEEERANLEVLHMIERSG